MRFVREMQALDFGAGTGLVSLGLLPDVSHVTAVDASSEMLRVLDEKLRAAKITHVRTLRCDIARAPLPANQFDLVVSSMVLHHLPDVAAVLQRLRPTLRAGGWIALADLDTEDGSFHSDMAGVFHKGLDRAEVIGQLSLGVVPEVVSTRPIVWGSRRTASLTLFLGRLR